MTSRPTFEDLTSKIPDWIFPGSLVLFDGFEHSGGDFIDAHTVGIVVNYWIIDLENIEEEDYNEMMKHGEWGTRATCRKSCAESVACPEYSVY